MPACTRWEVPGTWEQVSKKFRPACMTATGPDGVMSKRYRRQMYWQCDVGPRGDMS